MEAHRNCSTVDQVDRAVIAESQAAQANFIATDAAIERNSSESRSEVERFGFQGLNATHSEGSQGRGETERFGFHNSSVTQRASDRNEDATEKYGLKNFEATKDGVKDVLLQGCKEADSVKGRVSGSEKDILLQACHDTASIIQNTNSNFRDSLLQAANNTAALQASLCAGFSAIQLDAAKNAAAVALQVTLVAKDAEISAVTNAKDAIINATLNAAAVAKQIAECCCENKALIIEKANHTDMLIRQLDEGRVRDELRKTTEELIALRLRASLLPPPVAAVSL